MGIRGCGGTMLSSMSLADSTPMYGPAAWWLVALDTPTAWRCAWIGMVCCILSAWLFLRLLRMGRTRRVIVGDGAARVGRGLKGDAGTATLEFTLVFPVLLVLVLTLIQTTLMFTGNLFVHYAAFSATRAAIVYIPLDVEREPPNELAGQNSSKREAIRRAAVMAMLPVSGPGVSGRSSLVPAVGALYSANGFSTPRWAERLLDGRFGYADEHTDVVILADNLEESGFGLEPQSPGLGTGDSPLGPRDPIAVEVTHKLHLSIPFVSRLFGSGSHDVGGETARYAEISARFILTNEGVVDALPPKPPIDRN